MLFRSIDRLYTESLMRAEQETAPAMKAQALDGVVADFKALRDVTALAARVADMLKDKDIKKALSQEEKNDYTEARLLNELIELEQSLASDERHTLSLLRLRSMLTDMYTAANKADETPERQQARRVLDRKSTRLNSSHVKRSRMPSSA